MDSSYDIVTTTVIGKTPPKNNAAALSSVARLRDAYRHPTTRHLVDTSTGELSDVLIMLALNRFSMRTGSFARSGSNLFAFQAEKVILKKTTSVIELVRTAVRRICIEQTVYILIEHLIHQRVKGVNVIIFGGGLDAFALRLQKQLSFHSDMLRIYDVDFPGELHETKQFALNRLSMMGAHPLCHYAKGAPNVYSIQCNPADEEWYTQLSSSRKGFDKSLPSIVIGDGFGNLSQKEMTTLLTSLKSEVMTDDSKLMLSFSEAGQISIPSLPHIHGETSDAYEFAINPTDVPVFMRKLGFQMEGKMLSDDLQQQALQDIKLDETEQTEAANQPPPENFFLMGVPQWTNVCKLDELDIRTVPDLKIDAPRMPDPSLTSAP